MTWLWSLRFLRRTQPVTAEAEGLAAFIVGWLSGSVSRRAGRELRDPAAVRSSGTYPCFPISSTDRALMAALRRGMRGPGVSGRLSVRQGFCFLALRRRLLRGPMCATSSP
jgi:hypothetical protein